VLVGVVLAAGRSSRLGFPKALAELEGETFVARAIRTLTEGGCGEVCVVVAPPHGATIEAVLPGVPVVHNPEPDRGMLSSLQVGLGWAVSRPELGGVLFSLVDHPRLRASTVRCLIAAGTRRALRPVFAGRGGHPVLLDPGAVRDLLAAEPTASIRDVLGTLEDLEVDDPGVVDDIDDLAGLEALGGTSTRE